MISLHNVTLGIGIDTGGTYTDSAIVDLATGKVLSKAKALTTREDLVNGVLLEVRLTATAVGRPFPV